MGARYMLQEQLALFKELHKLVDPHYFYYAVAKSTTLNWWCYPILNISINVKYGWFILEATLD